MQAETAEARLGKRGTTPLFWSRETRDFFARTWGHWAIGNLPDAQNPMKIHLFQKEARFPFQLIGDGPNFFNYFLDYGEALWLFFIENNASYFCRGGLGGLTKMKPAMRLWLDQDGKAFGDGPYELLKRVEATGSLHKAAAQMGMAYSKAWKLTRMIEQRLGFMILEREVGGHSGGGSRITPQGKKLMSCYAKFHEEAREAVHRIFQKRFRSFRGLEPSKGPSGV